MKPPRYLLREYVLLKLLKDYPPDRFLEIGFGRGELLIKLAKSGYSGCAFDISEYARNQAKLLIKKNKISNVQVVDRVEDNNPFDTILFFEVIGFWNDPVEELNNIKKLLSKDGRIIFSFTAKKAIGRAEIANGGYKGFVPAEIRTILKDASFVIEKICNYGFPLVNMMKPVLNLLYLTHVLEADSDRVGPEEAMKKSSFATQGWIGRLGSIVINPVTIFPFSRLQMLFQNTDLGNGYVVVAKPARDESN